MAKKVNDGFASPADRYHAAHLRRRSFNVNDRTDGDLIEKLDAVENFQGYIKALIRADIASEAPIIERFTLKG